MTLFHSDDLISIGSGSWLRCERRECRHPTVPVSVVQGQTCIIMGQVVVKKALVICGVCGAVREFESGPYHPPTVPATVARLPE